MKDALRIAVAGCGVVGSGVVKMLTQNKAQIARAAGRTVTLTAVVDIKNVDLPEGVTLTGDIGAALEKADVLVETIGGARIAHEYTRRALEAGVSVVTSNKELVATKGEELLALAGKKGARYLYEASVGGGIPLLRPIKTCLAGNEIDRVYGIVNGSTNYLLTRMDDMGTSFPAALGEAKTMGYVEADPSADIDGIDARRKLMILAHEAFGAALGRDEVFPTVGVSELTQEDLIIARALGGAVKLIAWTERADDGYTGWVHPAFVPKDHILFGVRDVFNGVIVHGDFVDDVLFYGRGAGMAATASAVVGDILEIARGGEACVMKEETRPAFRKPDALCMNALVRVVDEKAMRAKFPDAEQTEAAGVSAMVLQGVSLRRLAALKRAECGIPLFMLS